MTQIDNKDFFYCYTKKLSLFLSSEGIGYILKAKSVKDDSIFTLYRKSDELQQALDKFKSI
ncbi:hypothetical protein [Ureibacillus aquaedulcis]|uniref:DUF5659 domain-containing protein n=1 Tax=Ureibacillus aquaedulcis TaxID=3058421 RepID=A0ABT8GU33_9BACL|nr:hypothetical protein [Ureibacillus sp. BA0131]MDN4494927.1 hypothetical protein [Ureibacillus sp. BA0131]